MPTRRATSLLLAITLALLVVRPAAAQATLVRSTPAAGVQLDTSPPSVLFEFSAELDANFSQAQLFDSQDQLIEPGPGTVSSVEPRVLRLILPDLPSGSYTAIWRVRLTADGSIATGRVPFGVGVAAGTTAFIPPPGAPDPATLPPPPLESVARWLNLLAATIALGGLAFGLLVWRPENREPRTENRRTENQEPRTENRELRTGQEQRTQNTEQKAGAENREPRTENREPRTDQEQRTENTEQKVGTENREPENRRTEEPPRGYPPAGSTKNQRTTDNRQRTTDNRQRTTDNQQSDAFITRFIQRMTLLGGVLFLLTNVFLLIAQASVAANVSLAQAIGAPLIELLSGQSGLLALARMALIFQIVVLAWRLPPLGSGPAQLWWTLLAIGGVALLTISMTAHAAATPAAALAVALDWLHLAATVVWLGGLLPLAVASRAAQRDPELALPIASVIRRYAWLTAACVAILTLTGIYSYTQHVGQLELLAATTYGRALLVKLALSGVLLLSVLLVLFNRMRIRSMQAALIIGELLLLTVGAMASAAPSTIAWDTHEQQGIAQSATVDNVDLTLRIAPAQIGDNEFAVDVADHRPGAMAAATTTVLLHFDMLGMPMEELQTSTQPIGSERYLARGGFTSMGGRWHIEVVLQRAGFADVRHTFEVDIVKGGPFVIGQ